jgi:Tol biopolymer transport system component
MNEIDVRRAVHFLSCLVLGALAACGPRGATTSSTDGPEDRTFAEPQCLAIAGYSGDAMEPFVTRDGRYLLFNSSNAPTAQTDIYVASLEDGGASARLVGPLGGVNSAALDGVPTVASGGALYFVSLRSYEATSSTIYHATFAAGEAHDVALVEGLPRQAGIVHFDVEVSADGRTLIYSRGEFRGGPVPESADLAVATGEAAQFTHSAAASSRLDAVNTRGALEYAAALSADGRELFFTRLTGESAVIYRAVRGPGDTARFGRPGRLAAIEGFAEAPALSPTGDHLYFHLRVGERFQICRVRRVTP